MMEHFGMKPFWNHSMKPKERILAGNFDVMLKGNFDATLPETTTRLLYSFDRKPV